MREYSDVAREARRTGKTVHFGRVFPICVEKDAELKRPEALKVYKGRVVFQGNQVKDQFGDWAIFQEIASAPASIAAAKAADAYGLLHGNGVEQCDAEQAYIQSKLRGDPTWVSLPEEEWPKHWKGKYTHPVCPLVLSLYGHPASGAYWEQHCEAKLKQVGFVPITEEWRSCFWHPRLKCMLVVYVDDFKLAGPDKFRPEAWRLIGQQIKTDKPKPSARFLGCEHRVITVTKQGGPFMDTGTDTHPQPKPGTRMAIWDQTKFMQSCVDVYLEHSKLNRT